MSAALRTHEEAIQALMDAAFAELLPRVRTFSPAGEHDGIIAREQHSTRFTRFNQDIDNLSLTTAELVSKPLDWIQGRISFHIQQLAESLNTDHGRDLVTIPLEVPKGIDMGQRAEQNGIHLRMVRAYSPEFDAFMIRFDVLVGAVVG